MCIRSREKGVVIQTVVRSTINLENVRFFDQATLKTNPDISNQQSAYGVLMVELYLARPPYHKNKSPVKGFICSPCLGFYKLGICIKLSGYSFLTFLYMFIGKELV